MIMIVFKTRLRISAVPTIKILLNSFPSFKVSQPVYRITSASSVVTAYQLDSLLYYINYNSIMNTYSYFDSTYT